MFSDPPLEELQNEWRWWLAAASGFTLLSAFCASSIFLVVFGGLVIALGPFIAEALIQFRCWCRQLFWITAGIISAILVVLANLHFLRSPRPWIPLIFLLPAALEYIAASGKRDWPWIWFFVTPALFGLSPYWIRPLMSLAKTSLTSMAANLPIAGSFPSEFYVAAALFGTVLFTRAFTGAFVACPQGRTNNASIRDIDAN